MVKLKTKVRQVVRGEELEAACEELRSLQRQRVVVMKSQLMHMNRLRALVASELGYGIGLPEKVRREKFKDATDLIREVACGATLTIRFYPIIKTTLVGIEAFDELKDGYEKKMVELVKTLPTAEWTKQPQQRGFGLKSLSIVVGECGNLANYATVQRVWRRMACAPWSFSPDGTEENKKTLMGSTWRTGKEGKLPAAEWEAYGYAPRRRSIAYLIGEALVKLNGKVKSDETTNGTDHCFVGPYRQRYDDAKANLAQKRPDYSDMRCHLHGMLLATKLLLKNLWVEWNDRPQTCPVWGV